MKTYPLYPGRQIVSFDGMWNFRFFEGKKLEELVPNEIETNDLFCVPAAFDDSPAYYCKRGTALYRKSFFIETFAKHGFLKCGGLGLRAQFILDGKIIGYDDLPYTPFECETGALNEGLHTLEILVDNNFDEKQMKQFYPFYDFYAFGGIYRTLELHLSNASVPVDRVRVTTVSTETGTVRLNFLFHGELPSNTVFQIRFDTEKNFRTIPSGSLELNVPNFKVWSPESPALHMVEVKLGEERIIERFGIRTVEAKENQILLNGKSVYLQGFNRHESYPLSGPATPLQLIINDIQNLKRMNCNFVRGCHYPQDPRFLDLCDEYGLLIWEESLGWGNNSTQLSDPEFIDGQLRGMHRTISESFNHPCVILRGFLNEFASETKEGYSLCKQLVEMIRKEDPERLVTFACNRTFSDICTPLVDVVAFNTYPVWISTDDSDMRPQKVVIEENQKLIMKYLRGLNGAGKPVIVSEMGCCGIYGQHDLAAAQWTEEFQTEYFTDILETVFAEPDICGITLWHMNDAKTFHRMGTVRTKPLSYNLAGVFDRFRRPKLAAMKIAELFRKHS